MDVFDEANSDGEDLLPEKDKRKSEAKLWNSFQKLPPDEDTDLVEDQTMYLLVIKILKIMAYIITFGMVLVCGVIAKGLTFIMTSQIKPSRTIAYCNKVYGKNMQFTAHSAELERISWYWAILFAFMLPELFVFFRSLRIWMFKGQRNPNWQEFLIPVVFETLHTIGVGLLVYTVLPSMDVIKAAMITNALCIIPAVFGMLSRGYDDQWILKCVLDVMAIIAQVSALFVWPLLTPQGSGEKPWLLPIAAFLISFGWWENFVDITSPFAFIRGLSTLRDGVVNSRYVTYTFLSLWKIAIFLGTMSLCFWINEDKISSLFSNFDEAFSSHKFNASEVRPPVNSSTINPPGNKNITLGALREYNNSDSTVFYVLGSQMLAAYLCYIFGKFACKICIQNFSFSFPILLVIPTTITVMISICAMRSRDTCWWNTAFPGYFFWTCPSGDFWSDFFVDEHAWVWILWILSQTWVTLHIWNPTTTERLAKSERLFATPYYNSLLIDQSMIFNRKNEIKHYQKDEESAIGPGDGVADPTTTGIPDIRREDEIPRIIACATMWHENREEMIEMLKSVFRMDEDQCSRRVALKYFEVADPAYYEYETNIFFDDAFQNVDVAGEDGFQPVINSFVRTFVGTIEEAASHVHQTFVKLRPPKKIPTPYGGRLEWILPGKTKLIVHIKNKDKIRHRKRWSQVMYMYYLLGYKLMEKPISADRKEAIAENTFLLALDGDIDFQPNAVEFLVDLMKKNKNLGAACGRIHPIGTGPMVWYQKFEYATGHWLQKATEHMIGCVLCSPGCFSLFRGKALMDDNVMARYTTMSDEPRHYVQYDQGEDRWLCTLLLQRGYRVEYSAASDAKTHAPEGFNEFYNQRRRWVPSTMANIMDLLMDSSKTIKANPDISRPYIYYQIGLMVGTILGPGTIFLMLVGAFVAAFKIDQWTSFMYNFLPIFIFFVVCFFCKADTQLIVAQILSAVYGLVMVAVLVAIALQIAEDGLLAPSSIFLVVIASSFVIAGILHPLEFGCLPHGLIYYITIPSMYLLLIIYSLFNLNNVSWGTREGPQTKTKAEIEAEAKEKEEEKLNKKKGLLFGLLPNQKKDDNDTEGSVEFSFAGLFKLMCCTSTKPNDDKKQLRRIADALERVTSRLDDIERNFEVVNTVGSTVGANTGRRGTTFSARDLHTLAEENGNAFNEAEGRQEHRIKRDDLMNPFWIEDKDLKKGEVDYLTGPEIRFWEELILEYLKPIDKDVKKEKELEEQLKELRNKCVFAFFMFNAIFVILIFLLQLEKETIHIDWPLGAKSNISYVEDTTDFVISTEYLELEPIGLVFVGFFAVVLVTQFVAMLFHRFGTLTQILAATEINWCTKDTDNIAQEVAVAQGVGLIRRLQKLNVGNDNDDADSPSGADVAGRRKTIHNLERQTAAPKPVHNLEAQFKRNFKSFAITDRRNTRIFQNEKAQNTFEALKERRSTVIKRRSIVAERRKSQMFESPIRTREGSEAPSTSSTIQPQDFYPPPKFVKNARGKTLRV